MDQLHSFFIGDTAINYIEAGFSDREAQAMAWIADQKPLGKFYGALTGSFVALTWGHFHNKIFSSIGLKFPRYYTQLAILGAFIASGDYITCGQRYGANDFLANNLYLNNNLFLGNVRSLNNNFQVLNRKFTEEEKQVFNQRAVAMRSSIPLANRKWIFNPNIETQEQFERRRKLNLTAPWEDPQIREQIQAENADKKHIIYGPKELSKLIDETGEKLGVYKSFAWGWRPLP